MRTSFHHQPEAQHQISSYQHAGRPITPSFGLNRPFSASDMSKMTHLCHARLRIVAAQIDHLPPYRSSQIPVLMA